jgi:hypothetical protein
MTESDKNATESTKSKRKYVRKPPPLPPPAPPAPPSAAVTALESQVLELVSQRMAANSQIAAAMQDAALANAKLQAAQQLLKQIEFEVQYRLSLIGQMKGGNPAAMNQANFVAMPEVQDMSYMTAPMSGHFGSIPVQPAPITVIEGGRRVRSESAESVRAAM